MYCTVLYCTGSCVEECSSDNPCGDNRLCCSNGCGHSCMMGQTVAPLCPALLRRSSGGIGAFVPQCEDDGSFSSVQCWGSTGYCWCVESTSGRPISEGVRGEPDCPGQFCVLIVKNTHVKYRQVLYLKPESSWRNLRSWIAKKNRCWNHNLLDITL